MGTAGTILNPQNAPRDRDKLKTEGPFQVKRLVQQLGVVDDKLAAFDALASFDDKVDVCLKLLTTWDETKKPTGQLSIPAVNASANGNGAPAVLERTPIELLTVANAPRDLTGLTALSPFKLRTLAQELQLLPTPAELMRFGNLKAPERATFVLKALEEWDAKNKGQAAAPPPPAGANGAPSAQTPGTSVPVVDAAAFRNAQEATAAGSGPAVASSLRRQPKTSEGGSEADLGGLIASVQALVNSGTNQATTIAKGLVELQLSLNAVSNGLSEQVEGIGKAMLEAMREQTALLTYTLMMVLTLAEERGIAPRLEILGDAVGQAPALGAMLKEVGAPGKAA